MEISFWGMWALSMVLSPCPLRVAALRDFRYSSQPGKRAPELRACLAKLAPIVSALSSEQRRQPFARNGGVVRQPCLLPCRTYALFCGAICSSQAEVSSNSEARRRISCFVSFMFADYLLHWTRRAVTR